MSKMIHSSQNNLVLTFQSFLLQKKKQELFLAKAQFSDKQIEELRKQEQDLLKSMACKQRVQFTQYFG
ncbi:hypothetical protein FGO68_gene10457 [Halteria grandinella]|uniref:Uncharacterized protein n=1 Tax=Halteria grandinella TaxID=5974 RepID=A0A8J8NGZ4_HALGN|nr:hypothetical protein FGO68_gene10457 [Halteria grandinella]